MKARYRLIRRGIRGGAFYCVDTKTGKRTSFGTADEDEARQIIQAIRFFRTRIAPISNLANIFLKPRNAVPPFSAEFLKKHGQLC